MQLLYYPLVNVLVVTSVGKIKALVRREWTPRMAFAYAVHYVINGTKKKRTFKPSVKIYVSCFWFCTEKGEFLKLADLLNVEVSEVVDRTTILAHYFPTIYYSKPSKWLCRVVKHK